MPLLETYLEISPKIILLKTSPKMSLLKIELLKTWPIVRNVAQKSYFWLWEESRTLWNSKRALSNLGSLFSIVFSFQTSFVVTSDVFIDDVHVGVVAAATWPLERGFDNRRCHHKILTIPRRQGSMLWNSFYCSRCHTCLLKLDSFWCIIWGT